MGRRTIARNYKQLSCEKGRNEAQRSRYDTMVRQVGNKNGCMHTNHCLATPVRCQADPSRCVYNTDIGTRETRQNITWNNNSNASFHLPPLINIRTGHSNFNLEITVRRFATAARINLHQSTSYIRNSPQYKPYSKLPYPILFLYLSPPQPGTQCHQPQSQSWPSLSPMRKMRAR